MPPQEEEKPDHNLTVYSMINEHEKHILSLMRKLYLHEDNRKYGTSVSEFENYEATQLAAHHATNVFIDRCLHLGTFETQEVETG